MALIKQMVSSKTNEIWLMRGRVKFGDSKATAPFASAIAIFRPNSNRRIIKFVDLRAYHQSPPANQLNKTEE